MGSAGARPRLSARFPGPFDVPRPAGADGWAAIYDPTLPFGPERRAHDEARFWFRDAVHWPRALRPFEAAIMQEAMASLAQFNHRHYRVPTAAGLEVRLLHGYCYLSPTAVDDEAEVAARAVEFAERAGHYYEHWDELYTAWMVRVRRVLADLEALSFPPLPEAVPLDEVRAGVGRGPVYEHAHRYRTLLDLVSELWQYHFEFLNLGYAAYVDYFTFVRGALPDVGELELAQTVAGIDVDLFRPDRELRRLARLAVELDVDDALAGDASAADALAAVAARPGGASWLAEWDAARHPWFEYSTGTGFYADDPVWTDHLDVPLGFLRTYVAQVRAGTSIDGAAAEVSERRDRLATALRARVPADALELFDDKLALARTVVHYVENHNFYVEHRGMALVWRRLRELSSLFVDAGFWPAVDDVFLLRPEEVAGALRDLLAAWATGAPALGPYRWPAEVAGRADLVAACAASSPPPALGVPPETVTEPFTIMLWGITTEALDGWLGDEPPGRELHGAGASPGVVTGRARVLRSVDELDQVCDGEIVVAHLTAPSWAPVFALTAGMVTESGGMMSHVAIVCREYGQPAVTGVAGATRLIRTGQLLRVDGTLGTVTVLD